MIEFQGKITGKTLKFHVQRYKKILVFSSFVASLLAFLQLGFNSFTNTIIFVLLDIILPLSFIICPARVLGLLAPYRIYINLIDRTIVSEVKGASRISRKVVDIIEVRDHGEFYTFRFNSLSYYLRFIVQKDLITQGTIEEFEEIFEEVLVRVK